jgi:hypothetical protein
VVLHSICLLVSITIMKSLLVGPILSLVAGTAIAAPAAQLNPLTESEMSITSDLDRRQVLGPVLSDLLGDINSAIDAGDRDEVVNKLKQVKATSKPKNAQQAIMKLRKMHAMKPSANLYDWTAMLASNGLLNDPVVDLLAYAQGLVSAENSHTNS